MKVIQKNIKENPKVNRDLYYICEKYLKSDENRIFTITGQRRLGKTTILQTLNNNFNKSIMITLSEDDTIDNLLDLIEFNLKDYDIFLIDEISINQGIFDSIQILFDYLINHNKKAIFTGTYNLAIKYMELDQSYGRTVNYTLNNLSIIEYINIFGTSKDVYLDYISFVDFFNSSSDNYINSLVNNIYYSYSKYINYSNINSGFNSNQLEKNKIQFYVLLILYKMVISSDSSINNIIKLEGIKFTDELNQKVLNIIRNKSKFYDNIDVDEFQLVTDQLISLRVIRIIPSFANTKVYKIIFNDFVLKKYIYDIIEKAISNKSITNYKITHYGQFYENIMNMQVSLYQENTYNQMYFKYNDYEVDDILELEDKIIFIDYKLGKHNVNFAFENISNRLIEISKTEFNKPADFKYIGRKPDLNIQLDINFVNDIRNLYLNKFKVKNNLFEWG